MKLIDPFLNVRGKDKGVVSSPWRNWRTSMIASFMVPLASFFALKDELEYFLDMFIDVIPLTDET